MDFVERWINLLEQTIRQALPVATGEAASVTRQLLGDPAPGVSPDRLTPRRREHAAFLDYTRALLPPSSTRPHGDRAAAEVRPAGSIGHIEALFTNLRRYVESQSPGAGGVGSIVELLQSHNGRTFTTVASEDQLESWWFHELVLLHGVASFAALSDDPLAWKVVELGTSFHRDEIQADHATADPWAIHAFALNPQTQEVAGGILNATMIQYAGEPDGVALVLLAESLYCLKHVAQTRINRGKPESV
ncbi:MAG TPA: hypothetical protein PLD59_08830 [Tepidisphaeraceae bacterium]|nr:hypothetical protein [Tepidisphaeraceae bacterium]